MKKEPLTYYNGKLIPLSEKRKLQDAGKRMEGAPAICVTQNGKRYYNL